MKARKIVTLLILFWLASDPQLFAQDNPVEHMSFLSEREELLRKKYLSYMSEVAHGERARKMEKRRTELIASIQEVIREGGRLRPYKGDVSLRNAFLEYWNILLHVFKEDYHKIIDIEEVAEQSYDMMEAYLLAQEKIDEKLSQAYDKVPDAYEAFAAKHNVTLTEGSQSKVNKKLDKVGKVNSYVNKIYLIYFKSGVQESNFFEALKKNDINGIEQSRSALALYAKEGLQRIDSVKTFNNDGSLVNACRKVLQYHQLEAEKKIPLISDYLIKADEFQKIKKAFENIAPNKRTQADVDKYNKSIDAFNKEVVAYNKNSEDLFNSRNKAVNDFFQSKKRFMDLHTPYK